MTRMFLTLLVLLAAPVQASDDDDHDRARAAFERGVILPLSQITAIATDRFGGHVIEVEFDDDDGRYLYELEVITGSGRVVEVEIDAGTGSILKVEND